MRQVRKLSHGRVVTLTSDFGLIDPYVAEIKARLLQDCPGVRLVDITHQVPAQDILLGSVALQRAVRAFARGTIHLAVVDPGVGSARRLLIVQINGQLVVCPDNGLITWSWRMHAGAIAREITWKPKHCSATFHGRDVMAPVCAQLANGESQTVLSRPIANPVLLDFAPTSLSADSGVVIHIDRFGNAITNITAACVQRAPEANIRVRRRNLGRLGCTYADVAPGKPLALIGSSGLLEIAVRNGSAARQLKLCVGDRVTIVR
jgi:S-adenosylmethionine hydrolase